MSALTKIATTTLSAVAVAGMLVTTTAAVSAQPHRGYWRDRAPMYDHHSRHRPHRDHGRHRDRNDNGAAAGLLGLGAGLILGGVLANSVNAAPPPPPPPPVEYDYYGGPRPWTPDWRAYCTSRYRSFNPRTGYFLGYDGDYHFCR